MPPRKTENIPGSTESVSQAEKAWLQFGILVRLQNLLKKYEPLYMPNISEIEKTRTLSKQRYNLFESWLETLATTGHLPQGCSGKKEELIVDVGKAVHLYELLQHMTERLLSPDAYTACLEAFYDPQPHEFLVRNVPTWKRPPPLESFKGEFDLLVIDEAFDGSNPLAPSDAFFLSPKNLADCGYGEGDQRKRIAFIESVDPKRLPENPPPAQIIDISEALVQKWVNRDSLNYFNLQEVLELFDDLNVRPASFKELLAFARDHWKPGSMDTNLSEKELLTGIQRRPVIALGAWFLNQNLELSAPIINLDAAGNHILNTYVLDTPFVKDYYFLVFRKNAWESDQ